ncbi:MAG: adenylate cyclase [Planctomycetes bacterium]|nr:adenylate cyclase [Planctomycetota bacterium]
MSAPLEIERVYLLARLPVLPADAVALKLEQGYLPDEPASDATVEGRVRRTTYPDGRLKHVHTIKRGLGLVREETERELSPEEFAELWPRTEGRRILKTRHKVPAGELTWEVDAFLDRNLVLAEVELSSPTQAVEPPPWLAPYVLREVTNDPRYRNYALATGGTPR